MSLPPVIYIKAQDSDTLFAIKSAVFTEDGAIPAHSPLRHMFDGKTKSAEPLFYKDEIPVFFLPIPSEIFKLMQQGFMFPDSWKHLRNRCASDGAKKMWDKYVEYYGLEFEPVDQPEAKRAKLSKKERKDADFEKTEAGRTALRWVYYRRITAALAKFIKTNHPRWKKLESGQTACIKCEFINTYNADSVDGVLTNLLEVDGEPRLEPVKVAFELGYGLPWVDAQRPCVTDMREYMEYHLEWKYDVSFRIETSRKSTRKTDFLTQYWPAGKLELTPKDHDVLSITISSAN